MAEKDMVEKLLEDYNDVFADIVNVLIFQGREVIKEDSLSDTKVRSQYKADTGTLHEQERDIAKYWNDGNIRIALYGIENQTQPDQDMPIRVLSYDGASYRSQMLKDKQDEEKTVHRERYPIATIVLYFGNEPWDKAKSLHEMFELSDDMKAIVNDYKAHIFEVAFLTEEQVHMFKSDFQIVADYFVQRRVNKEYTPSRKTIKHVDALLKFLSVMEKDRNYDQLIVKTEKGEDCNMSKFSEQFIQSGIQKGIEQGIQQGIEQGIQQSSERSFLTMIQRGYPVEEAKLISGISEEQAEKLLLENKN